MDRGHPAVAEGGCGPQRLFAVLRADSPGADEDWRMRLLHRLGIGADGRKADELAVERRRFTGPDFLHRAQILARQFPSMAEVHPHDFRLLAHPAHADAKQKTAAT